MIETTETENLPVIAERLPDRRAQSGIAALAELSEPEFQRRLEALEQGQARVQKIHETLMVPGVDFGVIPGTGNKPTLLKPGAERLAIFYGFAASFEPEVTYASEPERPPITVLTTCSLHLGDITGPIVATGCGTANSYERRYRWRRGERVCPRCSKEGTILRSKSADNWFCWAKKGGCGATFALDDERVTGQVVGDVENPDPWDLHNTLTKIAEKRAFVCAVLRATGTSSLYSQDLEDLPEHLRPVSQEARQSAPERHTAPPVASGKPPAAKAALRAAERPLAVSNPSEAAIEGSLVEPEEEEADGQQPPVPCDWIDCGLILSEEEVLGSIKRTSEFGGRFLCTAHGKQAIKAHREGHASAAEIAQTVE